jgi:DNA gyrase/topoisomerase IV subunit B
MPSFKDLEPCSAFPGEWNDLLAVGWLGKYDEFTKGPLDRELIRALERVNTWQPPNAPAELHFCPFCPPEENVRARDRALFIPGDGVLYVAPWSILHSMRKHGYAPPPAFVQAVLKSPSQVEFHAAITRHFPVHGKGIEVLEGLEPVRRRPGMYVGDVGPVGLENMLLELVGNSLDESLARAATRIVIDVDSEGWITVEDDGRGMPVERPQPMLPSAIEIVSRRAGMAYRAAFERGQLVQASEQVGPTDQRGTRIRFLPDSTIFKDGVRLDLETIERRLTELAWLCPTLELTLQGRSLKQVTGIPGWIGSLAPELVKETALSAVGTVKDVTVEVALAWRPRATEPLIRSFANYVEMVEPSSSERRGLITAMERFIGSKRASRKKKVMSGLVAVVHVRMLHPRFGGPTRRRLEVEEARVAVDQVVTKMINDAPPWWEQLNRAIG